MPEKGAMRLRFQKGDMLAVLAVLLLAGAVFAMFLPGKSEAAEAQIYRDGTLLMQIPLGEDAEYTLCYDYTNVITVRGGRVAVTSADCPGEDCVHSGWISSAGRSLVCLPNRLEIRIVAGGDDIDLMAG